VAFLQAVTLGAGQGTKGHDRWRLARDVLERKLAERRKHSKVPALIDLVLARPLVSAGMIAAELGITARAARDLIAELGVREITGRRRYRAWGTI
jgi:HTH DNA binding domain